MNCSVIDRALCVGRECYNKALHTVSTKESNDGMKGQTPEVALTSAFVASTAMS